MSVRLSVSQHIIALKRLNLFHSQTDLAFMTKGLEVCGILVPPGVKLELVAKPYKRSSNKFRPNSKLH